VLTYVIAKREELVQSRRLFSDVWKWWRREETHQCVLPVSLSCFTNAVMALQPDKQYLAGNSRKGRYW